MLVQSGKENQPAMLATFYIVQKRIFEWENTNNSGSVKWLTYERPYWHNHLSLEIKNVN